MVEPQAVDAKPRRPALEWIAAGIGAVLIILVFGTVLLQALDNPTAPPAVVVEVMGVTRLASGWGVTFRARNDSAAAASQVTVVGEMVDGEGRETSSTLLTDIPGRSHRDGGLFFSRDPGASLSVRATGYSEP